MKYDRHGRPDSTDKAGNIPGRTGIHDRPMKADGRHSGNWETDTTADRNGKGAILIPTEHPTDFILMEEPRHGREAAHAAGIAIRLSSLYMGDRVKTMTTDNSSEFSAHGKIMETMKGIAVCFADPYSSWQKGATKEHR